MIPQPYRSKVPAPTPRTIAKPPKAPLLGQAPSARPPVQPAPMPVRAEAQTPQAQAAKMRVAQQMGAAPARYQAPPQASQAMAVQQQTPARAPMPAQQMAPDPRVQAINAMKAKAGGDYPNPEWQPGPSFLKTTEPYAPAPVGSVVPATSAPAPVRYNAPVPSGGPVDLGIGAYNTTPVRGFPDTSGSFVPKSPVEMNPRYVPGLPNAGAVDPTIGPDGQTIPPRPTVPMSSTPLRAELPTGEDPSGSIDWEGLADALGIEGLQDQVKETTAKGTLAALTTPLSEYGFTPEELAAQEDQIIRQAAEAKAKLAQQMAGRGLGGSGLEIAGLGNVDVGALSAVTDLQTENKALQIESRLNEIKTFLGAYGDQLDNETRIKLAQEAADLQKEMFEYDKGEQKESDRHTMLNNLIAQLGGEQWDPDALAWAYDQLDSGASYSDVVKAMFTGSDQDVTVSPSVLKAAEEADKQEQGGGTSGGSSGSTGLAGVAEPTPKAGAWQWQWPQAMGPNKNTSPDDPNWLNSWNEYRDHAESTGQDFLSFPEFQDYWYSVIDEEQ